MRAWRLGKILFVILIFLPATASAKVPLASPAWDLVPRIFDKSLGNFIENDYKSQECPIGFIENYIGKMAEQIDHIARTHSSHDVHLLSSDIPVAFSLPNGTIYISVEMLKLFDSESELANIVAHEVAHSVYRTFSSGIVILTGTYGAILATQLLLKQPIDRTILNGRLLAATVALLAYDIRDEARADKFAIYTAARAGYDPYGMYRAFSALKLWFNLYPEEKHFDIFHPPLNLRIRNSLKFAQQLAPRREREYPNSWRFNVMKRMLSLCVPTD